MKKVIILVSAVTLGLVVMAQDDGMGNHNGNSSGSSSFSGTEMLLGAILIVGIVAILIWFFNSRKNRTGP